MHYDYHLTPLIFLHTNKTCKTYVSAIAYSYGVIYSNDLPLGTIPVSPYCGPKPHILISLLQTFTIPLALYSIFGSNPMSRVTWSELPLYLSPGTHLQWNLLYVSQLTSPVQNILPADWLTYCLPTLVHLLQIELLIVPPWPHGIAWSPPCWNTYLKILWLSFSTTLDTPIFASYSSVLYALIVGSNEPPSLVSPLWLPPDSSLITLDILGNHVSAPWHRRSCSSTSITIP